jgi:hypothetical protein
MSLHRHRHHDHVHGPWSSAPEWAHELGEMAHELGEMLAVAVSQNEAILAKLEDRPSKLSAADQAIMNDIFDKATATSAKLDAAAAPNPP